MFIYIILGLLSLSLLVYRIQSKSDLKPNLTGHKVLITGGSSGIGYCLAAQFVKHGAQVTLVARDLTKLQEAQQRLGTIKSDKVAILSLDLNSSFELLESVLKNHINKHGPPDIVINCAGYAISRKFVDTQPDTFENLMKTNYLAAVYTTKICLPYMLSNSIDSSNSLRGQHQHIVFISSMAGQVGVYGFAAYSASKYALRGFAEALDMELEGKGPRVTIAFPPDTDTPGLAAENVGKPAATKEMCSAGGLASPDQVARTIFRDILDGKLVSSFGLEGNALTWATAGLSLPVTYKRQSKFSCITLVVGSVVEIMAAAPLRAFGIVYALWLRWVARKY